ncbi:hypothetical protein D3C87_1489370 [compost metagenome]
MGQFVQGHAQQQNRQDAERHRQGKCPEHVAGHQNHQLRMGIRQVRRQQATTGGRHLRRHDWQQPDGSHLVDAVFLAGEHHVGNQHPTRQRHRHIQPPQHLGQRDDTVAPTRQTEQQEAVDDGRQPHGNRAEEHRNSGMPKNPSRLAEKQQPTRGIQAGEQ